MFDTILIWLGVKQPEAASAGQAHGAHGHGGAHGHTHGTVDPTLATTQKGIWAIKWSFVILAITAGVQLVIVLTSGSVALLADTIHNLGDAATAIPLWIAFRLVRRKPSARFTYGLGRVEDLAGVSIVGIILISALVAMYEAVNRLLHPQAITLLWQVAIAGFIGFIGNEAVAVFRIRVGRQIESAALIADGYHARADGFTSLAVVAGAFGVWMGFPLADPIIGILITLAIFGIVWQSSKAVFTRLLDGVDPSVTAEIRHAAEHLPAVLSVLDVRARWLGHRLRAEVDIAVSPKTSLKDADKLATALEGELLEHLPALEVAHVRVRPAGAGPAQPKAGQAHAHAPHHAPEPIHLKGRIATGVVTIFDTPQGERMGFRPSRAVSGLKVSAIIKRPGSPDEVLPLSLGEDRIFVSVVAPAEPHEFDAVLRLQSAKGKEDLPFHMAEPAGHEH